MTGNKINVATEMHGKCDPAFMYELMNRKDVLGFTYHKKAGYNDSYFRVEIDPASAVFESFLNDCPLVDSYWLAEE